MIGYRKISHAEFYAAGGFAHTRQYRRQEGDGWAYYREVGY